MGKIENKALSRGGRLFLLLLSCAALTALPLGAGDRGGDDVLSRFSAKAAGALVSFDYSYSMPNGMTVVKGSGNIRIQGQKYIMVGDGLEVYCDALSRWTLDRESEEMIIESVMPEDYLSNPASLLGRVDVLFPHRKLSQESFQGRAATAATLTPEEGTSSISKVKLYFRGETPVGMVMTLANGSDTTVEISSLQFLPKVDEGAFSFDEKTLGSGWISTDLRQ